jgi:hypothetical protein
MTARAIPVLRGLTSMLVALAVMLSGMAALPLSAPAAQPGHCDSMPKTAPVVTAGADVDPSNISEQRLERQDADRPACWHCGCAAGCAELSGLPAGGDAVPYPEDLSAACFYVLILPGQAQTPPFRPPRLQPF